MRRRVFTWILPSVVVGLMLSYLAVLAGGSATAASTQPVVTKPTCGTPRTKPCPTPSPSPTTTTPTPTPTTPSPTTTTPTPTPTTTTPASSVTIWPASAVPGHDTAADWSSVELGVKFKADVGGTVTGVRFYKGTSNTGTHVGNLWTSTGTLLASATFTNETASGWQQVTFATPVAVTAGAVYVASYLAPVGQYAYDASYFTTTGTDSPPLHALKDGANGGDGVYAYGASSTFPTSSYQGTNYWVDVVFTPSGTTPTPTPTTTTTTPTPTPTTTTPTPTPTTSTGGAYACVTSVSNGRCGPYATHPTITGANSDPWVDQNIWTGQAGYTQTLNANGPTDWYVTANANFGNGGVLTYPNTGFWMTGAVDSSTSITSTFSTTFPHNAQTIGWSSYDLWFNNWADEVMIQTDLSVNPAYNCGAVATATFAGLPWHLCVFGSERVWKPGTDDDHLAGRASGSVDIRAMLVWMEQNGYLPAASTWTAASYGFEVCNTSGVDARFQVNGFSWSAA